jgi:hypothetical protein
MRSSKAKALRKLATKITKGHVETAYQKVRKSLNALFLGQKVLDNGCTRQVYQQLKNTYPKGTPVFKSLKAA